MPLNFHKADAEKPAQRVAQPAKAAPLPTPTAPPPVVVNVSHPLANQTKTSLDGISLNLSGSGHLLDFSMTNDSAGTLYVHLYDEPSPPPDGSRPKRKWTLAPDQTADGFFVLGRPIWSGICLVFSTTKNTLTKPTTNSGTIEATFLIP